MHARIRYYQSIGVPLDGIHRSGRHMAAKLERVSGFVSFVMLDLGAAGFACVFVCNESAALDEADGVAQAWLAEQLGHSDSHSGTATTGEVVLQHGL
jgi:hypothetical protein